MDDGMVGPSKQCFAIWIISRLGVWKILTSYSQTYRVYTKNLIKIGHAISGEFCYKQWDPRIKKIIIILFALLYGYRLPKEPIFYFKITFIHTTMKYITRYNPLNRKNYVSIVFEMNSSMIRCYVFI